MQLGEKLLVRRIFAIDENFSHLLLTRLLICGILCRHRETVVQHSTLTTKDHNFFNFAECITVATGERNLDERLALKQTEKIA